MANFLESSLISNHLPAPNLFLVETDFGANELPCPSVGKVAPSSVFGWLNRL